MSLEPNKGDLDLADIRDALSEVVERYPNADVAYLGSAHETENIVR